MHCFISFCDKDVRHIDLEFLLKQLKSRTGEKITYDVYFERDYGDSLTDFMSNAIAKAGCCLLLLGPEYKKRIELTQSDTGVYIEYDNIVARLERERDGEHLRVIPIIWVPKAFAEVAPPYFRNRAHYASDLSEFRVISPNKNPLIPKKTIERCGPKLDSIADTLLRECDFRSPDMVKRYEENIKTALENYDPESPKYTKQDYLGDKYELTAIKDTDFYQRLYVKTRFIRTITESNIGLISGRKGSGKTTIVQVREHTANSNFFFPPIDVAVENWNLHNLIQSATFTQTVSDFTYVDIESKLFDYIWVAFVALGMLDSVIEHNNRISESQKNLDQICTTALASEGDRDFYKNIRGSLTTFEGASIDTYKYQQIFELSVTMVRQFFQRNVDLADTSDENSFRMDVLASTTLENFVSQKFGSGFQYLKRLIDEFPLDKFMFCFDRFDTEIQQYRKMNMNYDAQTQARFAQREIAWLSGLTQLVENSGRANINWEHREVYQFFSRVTFVVVLPFDRVTEIRQFQRDAVTGAEVHELYWQEYELLTMLRKRIQRLYGISDAQLDKRKGEQPTERYTRCLKISGIQLPDKSIIRMPKKDYHIDLFLDVLRHTLYRPREVILYFAKILSYIEHCQENGRKVEIESIRELISRETIRVIDWEFIGELQDTVINIKDIVTAFEGGKQVMSYKDIIKVIGPMQFEFVDHSHNLQSLSEKLYFLYTIGFLGYRHPRNQGAAFNQGRYIFHFIEPETRINFSNQSVVQKLNFAIHPLFVEYLFLTPNTERPVLFLNWDEVSRRDHI